MKYSVFYVLIVYLCIHISLVECFGGLARAGSLSGGTKSSFKSSSSRKTNGYLDGAAQTQNNEGTFKTKKSGGGATGYLSAWGIISLIMLVIIGSIFVYYVSVFYPLVCAKRGKYDVMEMTAL